MYSASNATSMADSTGAAKCLATGFTSQQLWLLLTPSIGYVRQYSWPAPIIDLLLAYPDRSSVGDLPVMTGPMPKFDYKLANQKPV